MPLKTLTPRSENPRKTPFEVCTVGETPCADAKKGTAKAAIPPIARVDLRVTPKFVRLAVTPVTRLSKN